MGVGSDPDSPVRGQARAKPAWRGPLDEDFYSDGDALQAPAPQPKPTTSKAPITDPEELEMVVSTRVEALYNDSKYRQIKQERLQREKKRLEDEMEKSLRASTMHEGKTYDEEAFKARVKRLVMVKTEREKRMAEQKETEEAERQTAEMAECTFKPKLTSISPKLRVWEQQLRQAMAAVKKMLDGQKETLAELAKVQTDDDANDDRRRKLCDEEINCALADTMTKVALYVAKGGDGEQILLERAEAYRKHNPHIDEERSLEEARADIVSANEARVKEKVLHHFTELRRLDRQRSQMRRLQLVNQVGRLRLQFAELEEWERKKRVQWGNAGIEQSKKFLEIQQLMKEFDVELLDRLKGEPWYVVARHVVGKAIPEPPTKLQAEHRLGLVAKTEIPAITMARKKLQSAILMKAQGSRKRAMEMLDVNKSGSITMSELETGLLRLHIDWKKLTNQKKLRPLVEFLDRDGNGTYDIKELFSKMMSD